jgi:hypothetical protein
LGKAARQDALGDFILGLMADGPAAKIPRKLQERRIQADIALILTAEIIDRSKVIHAKAGIHV